MPTPYVELHLHTAFSFLDGASLPEEMIARASDLGYQALAVTDHDGLYGAMEFAQAAQNAGIAPITGAEVTLIDGTHLTLLAETPTGYANLSKLLTASHHAGLNGLSSLNSSAPNSPHLPTTLSRTVSGRTPVGEGHPEGTRPSRGAKRRTS